MNIFFKVLTTSKRFQDTAGIARGAFRVLQGFQTTNADDRNFYDQNQGKFHSKENKNIESEKTEDRPKEKDPNPEKKIEKNKEEKKNESAFSSQEKVKNLVEKEEKKVEILKQEEMKKEEQKAGVKELGTPTKLVIESDNKFGLNENFALGSAKAVPAGPWSRAYNFGKLGLSILGGGISEAIKQNLSLSEKDKKGGAKSYFLTEKNAEKISLALCKMRGAPLKLGQVLSIQEDELIPREIRQAFERARKSANIMPPKQLYHMLTNELGSDWRSLFEEFKEVPFAAASIGQVHSARTKEGVEVAVKVQYPGVKESIDSDLSNLKSLLLYTNIFPKTMFLDQLIQNTKLELLEECDYLLEAEKQSSYAQQLSNASGLYVPKIIPHLTKSRILTSEFVKGSSLDFAAENYTQETRNSIGERIMLLTLEELFKYKFMQTDPNPANFLFNPVSNLLYLLDFGAARSYSKDFMDKYIKIVYGAAVNNRPLIMDMSKDIGFLTGEENKAMKQAHEESIITVGEPFAYDGEFDFGSQTMTKRIYKFMPIMFRNRLKAPPPEVYSLHRKLSGAFLLNMKLRTRVNCKNMFMSLYKDYKFSH